MELNYLLPDYVLKAEPQSLTLEERYALFSYTHDSYKELNAQLRNNNLSEANLALRDAISSGLNKLPNYNGICVRGTSKKEVENLTVGELFIPPNFLSSTKGEKLPNDYLDQDVLLKINSKSGKLIKNFSKFPEENEIIFNFGSKFVIRAISKVNFTVTYELLEID
jgi:hypothetical protein